MSRDRVNEVFHGRAGDEETIAITRERVDWIVDQVRGEKVLDLGTSQGIVALLLAERGTRVWAVDVAVDALAFGAGELRHASSGRSAGGRISFAAADGARLPFEDDEFDTVVFTEVLEHLEEPAPTLAEIARVLAPDGRLVLTTPFGLLPHDDHKRSYLLHALASELAPFFVPLEIDVQDSRFIRVVAAHTGAESTAIEEARRSFDDAMLAKETRYQSEIAQLRANLNAANRKYHGVTATLSQVQEQLGTANEKYRRVTQTVSELKERKAEPEPSGDAADDTARFIARMARRENHWDQLRTDLEEQLTQSGHEREELTRELDLRRERLTQLESELQELRSRGEKIEATLSEESRRGLHLEAVIAETEEARDALAARLEVAQRSLGIAGAAATQARQRAGELDERLGVETERRAQTEASLADEHRRTEELSQSRERLEGDAREARREAERAAADLVTTNELKDAYIERYTNAVRSFQRQKAYGIKLDTELKRARYQLGVIEASKAWKLIQLYWRARREGPSRALFADVLGILRRRLGLSRREKRFEEKLETWLDRMASSSAKEFVLMFSGTTFIQEHRGNRPIRLSRILLERKVPVFFSYWRWSKSEPLPDELDSRLFQSPIDFTMPHLDAIAARPMPGKKKIFVVTFPHLACARAAAMFNAHGWLTVYDVRDDWEEFEKVGAAKWYDPALERYIANNVDVVTAVSRPLQTKIAALMRQGEVHLSPNALDTRFSTGRRVKTRPVDGVKTVGYVGHLTAKWFDWTNLLAAARAEPEWRFEIVGHSMPEDLDLPPNVAYLGPKNHKEILELAKNWRVSLIPFQVSRLADGVDPIKVYEYLAMGLPVVSFRMPQIHDYPYVLIAEGAEGLRQRIAEAFELPMDSEVIERFLAVNRWQDRVDQLLAWERDDGQTGYLSAIAGR